MIIFDLICTQNHIFEGWFSSSKDYEIQRDNGLLQCPTCSSQDIKKHAMAPNIGLKTNQKQISPAHIKQTPQKDTQSITEHPDTDRSDTSILNGNNAAIKEAIKTLAKVQEAVLRESVWVGDRFSQEARSMHYGEADKRQIHGHASQKEVHELQEEGIEIAPLPLPFILDNLKN